MAAKLQSIAWNTVCSYPHNDISCTTSTNGPDEFYSQIEFDNYSSTLLIKSDRKAKLRVIDVHGRSINEFDVAPGSSQYQLTLTSGAYWVALQTDASSNVHPIIQH